MDGTQETPNLFPLKAHYFLYYCGSAGILLFIPTYARQLGFSTIHVGSILTILPLASMLSKLTLGSIADRFQCHKTLLMLCVVLAGTTLYSLQFIPPSETQVKAQLICSKGRFHSKLCSPDTREDRCLVPNIQTELGNSSIYCSMKCEEKSDMIAELCTALKNESRYCENSINRASNLNEYKHKYEYDFREIADIKPTKEATFISLDSLLAVTNITEVDDCLLFKINKMKDKSLNGVWREPSCDSFHYTKCYLFCNSSILMDTGEIYETGTFIVNKQYWMLLLTLTASYVGLAGVPCLGDTITYSLLGSSRSEYGKLRLWGSLGWGIMAILSGVLVDNFSEEQTKKNYSPVFYAILFFFVFDLLMISHSKKIKTEKSSGMLLDFGKVITNYKVIIFMIWVSSIGFLVSIANSFLYWHMEDLAACSDQEWITTLKGMYTVISCLCGEVPFFFLNSIIAEKFGIKSIMSFLLFLLGVMHLLFSLINNPWWMLPVGVLHGFLYSTYHSTMTSYASSVSTPATAASVQGLFSSAYDGLGATSGNFVAGMVFYYIDRQTVFLSYSLSAFFLSFFFMCINYLTSESSKKCGKDNTCDS